VLVHLRGRVVSEVKGGGPGAERAAMKLVAEAFGSRRRYEAAQRLARLGNGPLARVPFGPLAAWRQARDLPEVPRQSFREWWRQRS
jgi:L-lactate dehydrogenase complex protein LldF